VEDIGALTVPEPRWFRSGLVAAQLCRDRAAGRPCWRFGRRDDRRRRGVPIDRVGWSRV